MQKCFAKKDEKLPRATPSNYLDSIEILCDNSVVKEQSQFYLQAPTGKEDSSSSLSYILGLLLTADTPTDKLCIEITQQCFRY